jgi:hypothetical protein
LVASTRSAAGREALARDEVQQVEGVVRRVWLFSSSETSPRQ